MRDPFESERLTYRAIEQSDVPFIHTLSSDASAFAYANSALLKPVTQKWSQNLVNYASDKTLLAVIICLSRDPSSATPGGKAGTPIGTLHLTKCDEQHHRNTDLGIDIIAEYQGKGYGSEAIKWALNWAFQIAGLHRLGLNCYEWNERARGLYEKLGFVEEGRKREALWFDGRWWDLLLFGFLEIEWREKGEVVKLLD